MRTRIGLSLLLSVTAISASSSAQTVLRTLDDPTLTFDFGYDVSALGDVTGDGLPDIAVGGPNTGGGTGGVRVFDGQSGALVHTLASPFANDMYGFAIDDAGDVDGDTVTDIIIGGPGSPLGFPIPVPGIVQVISGATGGVIHTIGGPNIIQLGYAVAGLDDLDGDGRAEFAVGANLDFPNGAEAGSVTVYSGLNASPLYTVHGASADVRYGSALASIADVNGDGQRDLLVGAPGGLYVDLLSGLDGTLIRTFTTPIVGASDFGWSVDGAGDIDGDGIEDVIVGAPREFTNNGTESGAARVFSGRTGTLLFTMIGGFSNDRLGFDVSGAGDIDLDGTPDILIGATLTNSSSFFPTGLVFGVSGADWSTLFILHGGSIAAQMGWSVDELGDTNGNGFLELVAGVPGLAEARQVDTGPDTFGTNYCVGAVNSTGNTAILSASGSVSVLANDLILYAYELPASQNGLFYYGPFPVQVPFGNGFRCIDAGATGFARLSIEQATSTGLIAHHLDNTNPPTAATLITAGSTWHFQSWYRDPAAGGAFFNLSDGLILTFQP